MNLEDWLEWTDPRGGTLEEHGFLEWFRDELAEAWDAGHGAPCDKWIRSEMCREYHPNPYRTGGAE